jgi:2,3-bisphosphoglycerate-independent phosphoglycerate mutase
MTSETVSQSKRPRPAVLMVLDGFGVAPDSEGNAITQANMPVYEGLVNNYPVMTVRASGEEVGLSWGEMGNSEVGHLAIGAGRVYYQTLPRINRSIEKGDFFEKEPFVNAMEHAKQNNGQLHLVGMISEGRVHSVDAHCHALLKMAKEHGVKDVVVHAILDGRDTVFDSGVDFIKTLQEKIQEIGIGDIVSLAGRYYTMDRDNRWKRTKKGYDVMVSGEGETATDPLEAIKESYANEVYDEKFVPTVITDKNGEPKATIDDGDAVILFNFRADRMRQITKAFALPEFDKFDREEVDDLFVATMTEYEQGLPVEVAFPPVKIENCLAEVVSDHDLTQLHIAETEKYAHVTFFLNGTREDPFPGEERVIIPSPRVASYDEAPEMSAKKITDRVVKEVQEDNFDVIMMNYANPDMVSHTGDLEASIKAMEHLDTQMGRVIDAVLKQNGVVLITADHGNAEELLNLRTGEIDKEHATNPVPFHIVGNQFEGTTSIAGRAPNGDLSLMSPVGMLADVAPTFLKVINIEKPEEMTGQPLL